MLSIYVLCLCARQRLAVLNLGQGGLRRVLRPLLVVWPWSFCAPRRKKKLVKNAKIITKVIPGSLETSYMWLAVLYLVCRRRVRLKIKFWFTPYPFCSVKLLFIYFVLFDACMKQCSPTISWNFILLVCCPPPKENTYNSHVFIFRIIAFQNFLCSDFATSSIYCEEFCFSCCWCKQ